MLTTHDLIRTNPSDATIKTSLTYGASSVANDISKRTTIRSKGENKSLLVPVVAVTSRNDLEDTPHKSDTGIIIGAVTGSIVFLMMTFLGIICIRRGLLQRNRENKSKHDGKNTKMHNTDTIGSTQCHDVPLETGLRFTVIAQLESNSEESHTSIVGKISDLRKPTSILDLEGSKFNYETLIRKEYVNSSNPNSNITYDGYEHLNRIQERRDGSVTRNIYDTVQFE
ncbi:hypothetical protein ACJMK2_022189 [Sinanodonta woodiana]|uniref:Uncharacterized protein n=1 Tax=Sinanodonta woodiana TaxID=1069815 RepID=A0ABD3TJ21_SINWO